jgi:hypothetical protein
MRNKQTNASPEDTQEQPNHNLDIQNLKTNSAANSLSRRSFLGRAGASTMAVAAASAGLPSLLSEKAEGQIGDADARSDRSFQIRFNAAARERNVQVPPHTNNGDEGRYATFIGNFSQGLPHNSIGEVDPTAYQALLTAVTSGKSDDFAKIPLGGNAKLSGPQGGLAFDLEGTDCGQLSIPPSPSVAGAERAGEMVEDYWMALARDIPISQYGNESITAGAIADLNKLSRFGGPKVNGQVTPGTLFRGFTPGDLIGPYLSQFFLLPLSLGNTQR